MRARAGLVAVLLIASACAGGDEARLEPEPAAPEPPTAASPSEPPAPVDEAAPADEPDEATADEPALARGAGAAASEVGAALVEAPVEIDPAERERIFGSVIRQVVRMPRDRDLQGRARARGMRFMNVMWEDTGRSWGSSGGPNISDLTLEVIERREGRRRPRTHLLPVLRFPNFTDRTADLPADQFFLRVGNQRAGAELSVVTLPELLTNLSAYLSAPDDFRATSADFTAPRDTHYLVSAQHVFVPVPPGVRVEFAPVLFNYQSYPGAPAVLCIVATREGTSIQIIENREDGSLPGVWGQRLFFNHAGQRTTFTAERHSDVVARVESGAARADDVGALDEGADMVAIIQVPLRLPAPRRRSAGGGGGLGSLDGMGSGAARSSGGGGSDVEVAVVGHGLDEGPFIETRGRRIRRDTRFPIRVTIQFYRATSNGIISDEDLEAAVAQIQRVYDDADFVGSLVVGSQARPTAHHVAQ